MTIAIGTRVQVVPGKLDDGIGPSMVDKRPRQRLVASVLGRSGTVKRVDTGSDGVFEPVYAVDFAGNQLPIVTETGAPTRLWLCRDCGRITLGEAHDCKGYPMWNALAAGETRGEQGGGR